MGIIAQSLRIDRQRFYYYATPESIFLECSMPSSSILFVVRLASETHIPPFVATTIRSPSGNRNRMPKVASIGPASEQVEQLENAGFRLKDEVRATKCRDGSKPRLIFTFEQGCEQPASRLIADLFSKVTAGEHEIERFKGESIYIKSISRPGQ